MTSFVPKRIETLLFLVLLFFAFGYVSAWYAMRMPRTVIEPDTAQNMFTYIKPADLDKRAMTSEAQSTASHHYLQHYYAPWQDTFDPKIFNTGSKVMNLVEYQNELIEEYSSNPVWGENFHQRSRAWVNRLATNMDLIHYPNRRQSAITLHNTNLRALPTNEALYHDWHKAGEGFPFDNLQHTSVSAGTPLYLSQVSNDGAWGFVIAGEAFGWLPMTDIAIAGSEFKAIWQTKPLLALTSDHVTIKDIKNIFYFKASIGTLYPMMGTNADTYDIGIPVADNARQAQIKSVSLASKDATPFPMAATNANFATIANQLMAQPYGWGGLFGYRDCSEMTRHFYTPFGIWLPRQSTGQMEVMRPIALDKLPKRKRMQYINQQATPFMTLLGRPGHVMIYVGQDSKGVPIVFHSLWGLRTHYPMLGEGRAILGKTAITSLMLGKQHYFTKPLITKTQQLAVVTHQ